MKKIFFLLNKLEEFDFQEYIKKYLGDVSVSKGESLPESSDNYDLIILWSYRKILKNISNKKNIILFHSTDLPSGKGWAPIYYSIYNNLEYFTISGIFAADEVDSGDIIIKARFKIKNNYTAEIIRECDREISILLIKKILERFDNKPLQGKKQEGISSTYVRRKPEDNQISTNDALKDIINHLRACEKNHPAFFVFNGTKYFINIIPAIKPKFPKDLEIEFYDSS